MVWTYRRPDGSLQTAQLAPIAPDGTFSDRRKRPLCKGPQAGSLFYLPGRLRLWIVADGPEDKARFQAAATGAALDIAADPHEFAKSRKNNAALQAHVAQARKVHAPELERQFRLTQKAAKQHTL